MLLNMYLGTTAISWAIAFTFAVTCNKKLEKKGYKFVEKKSILENITSFIPVVFKGSIPICNFISAITLLCMWDMFYECLEEGMLANGEIYMPTEETTSSEEMSSPKEETNIYTENIENINLEKKYDEMTLEEKLAYLERERKRLNSLSRAIVQSIEDDSKDKEQQGPVLRKIMNQKEK